MKKTLFLTGSILLIILTLFILVVIRNEGMKQEQPTPLEMTEASEETLDEEYQASFLIFTNGTKRTFEAAMYRNQNEHVYIGEGNASIITVQSRGVTWNDFFQTLPFSLTSECLTTGTGETYCTGDGGELRFFLNNRETPNVLGIEIRPEDRLLVTFGVESEDEIQEQINQIP